MSNKKLVAIYVLWDDYDLFFESARNIRPLVDGVILIHGEYSNSGERCELMHFQKDQIHSNFTHCIVEPDLNKSLRENETFKRNAGLKKAKELGFTHFLMMDADEFYEPNEFLKEKERIFKNDLAGTVCRTKVYFREPTLTVGYDVTLVPFIHKITPDLKFEWNTRYPYAFEGPKRHIRIDPTRQMNITSGVEWSEITMFHYSWIRSDVMKKIRNSTARQNIERSSIIEDYKNAKAGYFCKFYNAELIKEKNIFELPDILDKKLLGID